MGFWAAAIPIATSLISGMGSKGQKTSTQRVPSVLGAQDLEGPAKGYSALVEKYVKSEPGLSGKQGQAMLQRGYENIEGSRRGADLRTRSYMAQQGIRGPRAAGILAQNQQAEMEAKRAMVWDQMIAEHGLRESDIVRRAAVAAQYLWPAESARGAGQVSSVKANNPSQWLDAIGAGARAFGALSDAGFYNKGSGTPTK